MIHLEKEIARRFILGKQGLWPGRRWQGVAGTEQAMRGMDYLQLDPLQMIARSHDISLYGRVVDYQPAQWEEVTYAQRKFFDWGGWLATRPMDDWAYWRVVMHRERDGHPDYSSNIHKMEQDHHDTIVEMRDILQANGTVSNRDFKANARKRTISYRGRKDSSLALYYLWRTGEVMTHHRENFERVYALAETIIPSTVNLETLDDDTVDRYLFKKEISFSGLARLNRKGDVFLRGVPFSRKQLIIDQLLAEKEIIELQVDGWKGTYYALKTDAPLIDALIAGRIPPEWTPLDTTTVEEVTFLAPLDQVSARGRAKDVFDFHYVWEVYKPAAKREYGYYVLPILWGDQLVGRFDSKFDKQTQTLIILGFWLEDDALAKNGDFAIALGLGFKRFIQFLGASQFDGQKMPTTLLKVIKKQINQ